MKRFLFIAGLFLILPSFSAAQTVASVCTNFTSDLSSGMTDSVSNGPILQLQNFLASEGLLNATPNGHFGPATLAATLVFQSANGIPSTGYVGPLTRVAIENKSCTATNTTINTSTQTTPTNVSTPSAVQSPAITSPATNESILLGTNYTIKWSGNPGYNYSIVLEDQYGVGKGIIASSLSTMNQYVWQVGRIISSGGTGYSFIVPGTYRIHIETSSNQDMYSGLFAVNAPPISISSMTLSSIPADGNTSAVIFGSGFMNPSYIYINGYSRATTLFVSPDGKIIVFSIPSNTFIGAGSLNVSNQYGSYSNSLPITVTSAPAQ